MAVASDTRISIRSLYQRHLDFDPPCRYVTDPMLSIDKPFCLDLHLEGTSFICLTLERIVSDSAVLPLLQLEGAHSWMHGSINVPLFLPIQENNALNSTLALEKPLTWTNTLEGSQTSPATVSPHSLEDEHKEPQQKFPEEPCPSVVCCHALVGNQWALNNLKERLQTSNPSGSSSSSGSSGSISQAVVSALVRDGETFSRLRMLTRALQGEEKRTRGMGGTVGGGDDGESDEELEEEREDVNGVGFPPSQAKVTTWERYIRQEMEREALGEGEEEGDDEGSMLPDALGASSNLNRAEHGDVIVSGREERGHPYLLGALRLETEAVWCTHVVVRAFGCQLEQLLDQYEAAVMSVGDAHTAKLSVSLESASPALPLSTSTTACYRNDCLPGSYKDCLPGEQEGYLAQVATVGVAASSVRTYLRRLASTLGLSNPTDFVSGASHGWEMGAGQQGGNSVAGAVAFPSISDAEKAVLTDFWSHVEHYVSSRSGGSHCASTASIAAPTTDPTMAVTAATATPTAANGTAAAALSPPGAAFASFHSGHSEGTCPCGPSQHQATALLSFIYLRLSSTLTQPCLNPEPPHLLARTAAGSRVHAGAFSRLRSAESTRACCGAMAASEEASAEGCSGAVSRSSAAGLSVAEALRCLFAAVCRPLSLLLHSWVEGREWEEGRERSIVGSSGISGSIPGRGDAHRHSLECRDGDCSQGSGGYHRNSLENGAGTVASDGEGPLPLPSPGHAPYLPVFLQPYRDVLERAAVQWRMLSLSQHGSAVPPPHHSPPGGPGGGLFAHLLLQSAWQEVREEMMRSNAGLVAASRPLPVTGGVPGSCKEAISAAGPSVGLLCRRYGEGGRGSEGGVWSSVDAATMSFAAADVRRVRDGSEQAVRRAATLVAECVKGAGRAWRMPVSGGSREAAAVQEKVTTAAGDDSSTVTGREADGREEPHMSAEGSGAEQQLQGAEGERGGGGSSREEVEEEKGEPGSVLATSVADRGTSASEEWEEEEGRGRVWQRSDRGEMERGTVQAVRLQGGGGRGWRMEHSLADVWDPHSCEEREVSAMLSWMGREGDSESVQPSWTFRGERGQSRGEGLQGMKPLSECTTDWDALRQQEREPGGSASSAREGIGGKALACGRSAVAASHGPAHGHPCMVTSNDASVDDVIAAYILQPIMSRYLLSTAVVSSLLFYHGQLQQHAAAVLRYFFMQAADFPTAFVTNLHAMFSRSHSLSLRPPLSQVSSAFLRALSSSSCASDPPSITSCLSVRFTNYLPPPHRLSSDAPDVTTPAGSRYKGASAGSPRTPAAAASRTPARISPGGRQSDGAVVSASGVHKTPTPASAARSSHGSMHSVGTAPGTPGSVRGGIAQDSVDLNSIHAFDFIALDYQPPWLASLVLSPDLLSSYSSIYSHLLRILHVQQSLRSAIMLLREWDSRAAQLKRFSPSAPNDCMANGYRSRVVRHFFFRAGHFVSTLLTHYHLEIALASAAHMRDVISPLAPSVQGEIDMFELRAAHNHLLDECTARCFLSEEGSEVARKIDLLLQLTLDVARSVLSAHLTVAHVEYPLHCDGSTVWAKVQRKIQSYMATAEHAVYECKNNRSADVLQFILGTHRVAERTLLE